MREIADEYGKDIKVAVHYTNIDDSEEVDTMAANLQNAGVDYDLFGLSYYPYWDGTMENMQAVAENIENTYGKDVYIAETSYCYTTEDGDGFANSFAGTEDLVDGYAGDGAEPGDDDPRHLCSGGRGGSARCLLLGRHLDSGRRCPMRITRPSGKNTEAAGRAAIRRTMIRRMPDCITEAVPGTIRRCLILRDIRLPH